MRTPQTPTNEVHTMTLDGVTRREFIKLALGTTAGLACGLNPLESEASEGDYDFQMPPDRELKQYLSQPVDDTIGTPGVDYIPVNDENYDQIVKGSNKPVMVLFYNDTNTEDGADPCRGLAGLAKVLNDTFQADNVKEGYAGDDILFCAYKINNRKYVNDSEFNHVTGEYPIEDTPALAFYKHEDGNIKHLHTLSSGFSDLETLKHNIEVYFEDIPQYMLD